MSDNNLNTQNQEDPLAGKDVHVQLGGKTVPLNSISKPHAVKPKELLGNHHLGSHVQGIRAQQNPLVLNNGHRPTLDDAKK